LFLWLFHERRLQPTPRKLRTQRSLRNLQQAIVGASQFHKFRLTHLGILRRQIFGTGYHATEILAGNGRAAVRIAERQPATTQT
jgi:hypothetical protein